MAKKTYAQKHEVARKLLEVLNDNEVTDTNDIIDTVSVLTTSVLYHGQKKSCDFSLYTSFHFLEHLTRSVVLSLGRYGFTWNEKPDDKHLH